MATRARRPALAPSRAPTPIPLALEDGLFELPGTDTVWLWVQTCPAPKCSCRSALILATARGRDVLLEQAAVVRAAWNAGLGFADAAPKLALADLDAFDIDIDAAIVSAPAGDEPLDLASRPRLRDIVARLDGETLDAIARLWVRGKGLPDREQQALDAREVVLRGWKRGDMLAWSDVFPIRTDLYELDDRLVEADDLYCPVPDCDCGEVVVDFVTAAPPRGGPPVGRVRILPTGDPKLESRERSRDPVRDRERIEQLWAAFVGRHPRWRERFARRIPTMKAIGVRVVPEPSATASAGRVSKNAPCPCGSGQKYKKCCGVVQ